MPTGYTAAIYDGKDVSLRDYAASCAHAFGAFIHQRDSTSDSVLTYPPKPENDSYYVKALADAHAELKRWQSLSEEAKYAEWSEYFKKATVRLHKSIAENSELRARYQSMLADVQAVDVPSKLQNFKDFMISQLEDSIKFDCGDDDKYTRSYYQPQTFSAWCDAHDEMVLRDVNYYREELRKEVEWYEERVEYINMMRDTFGFDVVESDE